MFKLPLFWKFSIAIAATVILFGSINLWFIRNQVYRTFEKQIVKQGLSIAQGVAEQSVDAILYDDLAFLNQLITKTKQTNPDVRYIFIVSSNERIIAHTFQGYIPKNIIEANQLVESDNYRIVTITDSKNKLIKIRDIAAPILESQIGVVRIGLSEDDFLKEMKNIGMLFALMVLFFLVLGIIAAFILSYIITNPIKLINQKASIVNVDSIQINERNFYSQKYLYSKKLKNLFNLTDEIDVLENSFNEMLNRIQQTYKELKDAQESLSQSEKMASVGTLAAGLAHEINNPLAGIRNCIRRIESNPENIRQNAEYISMMSDAFVKIEKVVEGMLNFSRKQEFIYKEVNIHNLIDNTLLLLKFQLEKSDIEIVRAYIGKPLITQASPNHLEQVFVNVLLNSIDAINEKKEVLKGILKGIITIRTKISNKSICLEFIDNGIGVPEQKIASIFDPFFTLKKIKQGTGLGLSVSYNIITSHNGQIVGKNNVEGGLTISITLPLIEKN
jgi:two-component system, NtrC family, sensor kinase